MWKKYIQRIVLVVIAVLGLQTGIENFKSGIAERSNDSTIIAAWNDRLAKLIEPIPFERGFVGYLSDEDIPGTTFNSNDAEGEFVLTQYAIAPLIIVRGTNQEWMVEARDLEGINSRILSGIVDIGAYETAIRGLTLTIR